MTQSEFGVAIVSELPELKRICGHFTMNPDERDDLMQDTLLKAQLYADTFRDGTNLTAWLYTIAKRLSMNRFRGKALTRRTRYVPLDSAMHMRADTETDAAFNGQPYTDELLDALDRLDEWCAGTPRKPVKYEIPLRSLLMDYYVNDLTSDELTTKYEMPYATIRTLMHKSVNRLREDLAAQGTYTQFSGRRGYQRRAVHRDVVPSEHNPTPYTVESL